MLGYCSGTAAICLHRFVTTPFPPLPPFAITNSYDSGTISTQPSVSGLLTSYTASAVGQIGLVLIYSEATQQL